MVGRNRQKKKRKKKELYDSELGILKRERNTRAQQVMRQFEGLYTKESHKNTHETSKACSFCRTALVLALEVEQRTTQYYHLCRPIFLTQLTSS